MSSNIHPIIFPMDGKILQLLPRTSSEHVLFAMKQIAMDTDIVVIWNTCISSVPLLS